VFQLCYEFGSDIESGYIRLRYLYFRREYNARVSIPESKQSEGRNRRLIKTFLDVLSKLQGTLYVVFVCKVAVFYEVT